MIDVKTLLAMVEQMKMTYAPDAQQALALARRWQGEDARVTVVPNGVSIAVRAQAE